jgi:hypothetical protein
MPAKRFISHSGYIHPHEGSDRNAKIYLPGNVRFQHSDSLDQVFLYNTGCPTGQFFTILDEESIELAAWFIKPKS